MSTRARIQAFKDALEGQGAAEIRMQLTTEQALDLLAELPSASAQARAAADSLGELIALPPPVGIDETTRRSAAVGLALAAFWDAFEGTECDGVTLIRKR